MLPPRPTTRAHAADDADVLRPRDALRALLAWARTVPAKLRALDADALITKLVERPGAHVMWALKLGRFPKTAQDALRDQNTVAGVLAWLWVLAFLVGVMLS